MSFSWLRKRVGGRIIKATRRRRRRVAKDKHYEAHKERARLLIHERLTYWNQFYSLTYNRVAIRNQRSRWGSCSTKQNLNFNYRLVFLPLELVDYVIVHELCHLKHFNHGREFWAMVGTSIHNYEECKSTLQDVTRNIEAYMHSQPISLRGEQLSSLSDTVPTL